VTAPVIETAELCKRYGSLVALERLTFAARGRAIGLLGPNGAGKSTLVKVLLGLIPASAGRASVLGLDCRRDGLGIREVVGYMPEHESFIPGLDAVTTAYLAGRLVGMPHADAMQRAHIALNFVGLDEQRYRKVETYSTGAKQKAKLAQAIVHHPRLLLLDEPTAGLDPRGRDEMLALIRDIAREKGIHVVLSTHILPDVEATCDDVVILDRGALVHEGPLAALGAGEDAGFEVRVKGDRARFAAALEGAGAALAPLEDDGGEEGWRVRGLGSTEPIVRAAATCGVQLRRMARGRSSLDALFTRLLEESRAAGGGTGAPARPLAEAMTGGGAAGGDRGAGAGREDGGGVGAR
jgi:ABC-2 type transport system ATP-binding protein